MAKTRSSNKRQKFSLRILTKSKRQSIKSTFKNSYKNSKICIKEKKQLLEVAKKSELSSETPEINQILRRYVIKNKKTLNINNSLLKKVKFITKDRFKKLSSSISSVSGKLQYLPQITIELEKAKNEAKNIYDGKFFEPGKDELESFVVGYGDKLYIFEIDEKKKGKKVQMRLTISSGVEEEEYFAICTSFVYIQKNKYPVVVAGGKCKVLQVFLAHNGKHLHNLFGHSGDINEICASPVDFEIVASVSNDETCRLYNIRHGVNLATFGGPMGHTHNIISLDFSLCGNYIVTCGSDYKVMLWGLKDKNINSQSISTSSKKSNNFEIVFKKLKIKNVFIKNTSLEEKLKIGKEMILDDEKKNKLTEQIFKRFPLCQNRMLHSTIIDGVRFYDNYIITKDQSKILSMWKFGKHSDDITGNKEILKEQRNYSILKHFVLPNCNETWFHKIEIDPSNNILAVASDTGFIYLYDITKQEFYQQPDNVLTHYFKKSKQRGVRNITFSHDSRYLLSVGDNYTFSVFKLYN
ncbi:Polycomb protein EED [Strongyloides ratti]|uniref:Polycomb protein EED n=1 Tax=Strongyloides ratti TaxID=34506 RepID=A0A090KPX3_STRRB|nr:Polycomb protein EED [Strongyloides ratti]CEF59598.1 Polycomb protein EED [Strongyloides ratti]